MSSLTGLSEAALGAMLRLDAATIRAFAAITRPTARTPSVSHEPSGPRSVLVVALGAVGDAVLLSPFLRELRRSAPSARIDLVASSGVVDLFIHCPYVDEVIPFDISARKAFRPILLPARAWALWHDRGGTSAGYDVAIMPQWEVDYNFATAIASFSGAVTRVGYSEHESERRALLNPGFDRLLTQPLHSERDANPHEVARSLAVLRALGLPVRDTALELWLSSEDRARAASLVGPATAATGPLVALGIGANLGRRRWPVERYIEVARRLFDEGGGGRIVVVGGDSDRAAQQSMTQALGPGRVIGLAGATTLRQSAAVLERCDLFVGNDSGPMHLAAAAGIPVVEVSCHPRSGSVAHHNAPERFGPWGVPATVLRPEHGLAGCEQGCVHPEPHCIMEVSAEAVAEACIGYLSGAPGAHLRRPPLA